jgi:brefeldin A-inhibited guanine nucleotide-exchange protein
MCQEPETIIDIFLNYDCDPGSLNVFENMILVLDKITKGRLASEGWITAIQETQLKVIAVQSMVNILSSILSWHPDDKEETKLKKMPVLDNFGSPDNASLASAEDVNATMDLESARVTLSEKYERQKQAKEDYIKGIVKFNLKPKEGISFLTKLKLVENSPQGIAKFFLEAKGLSKEKIGEVLGKDDEFSRNVLYCFVESQDFRKLEIDEAIRAFMGTFRLPGEAQQIDRIMEKFAEHYLAHNPNSFANAQIAYVLSYAIILLNTDQHNPQVKNRVIRLLY